MQEETVKKIEDHLLAIILTTKDPRDLNTLLRAMHQTDHLRHGRHAQVLDLEDDDDNDDDASSVLEALQKYRDELSALVGTSSPTGAPSKKDDELRALLRTNLHVGTVALDLLADGQVDDATPARDAGVASTGAAITLSRPDQVFHLEDHELKRARLIPAADDKPDDAGDAGDAGDPADATIAPADAGDASAPPTGVDPNTIARFERLIVRHLAGEALDALANDAQVMRADLRAAADAYRAGARAALAGFLASKLGANN